MGNINMVVGGEIYQAASCSRQAIERLIKDGLTPTPDNYRIYYHYFASDLPELNAALDLIAAGGKVTQAQSNQLYDKFFSGKLRNSFFQDVEEVIDGELRKVMDLLSATAKETNQFGDNLDNFSGTLRGADSLEMLRGAVEKIAAETHAVAAENRKLQTELQTTTLQLSDMRLDFDRVHKESQIDSLTEVGNRKFFDREMARAMREAREQNAVLSVLMVDIDHFKQFNDLHGHIIGDQVLRLVARTLVENLKGRDVIARYGGEEFVILLPQTRLQDAERVANLLRTSLASKRIQKRGSNEVLGIITISLGAAQYMPGEDGETMVSRADSALYKAKQTGRNKVICAE